MKILAFSVLYILIGLCIYLIKAITIIRKHNWKKIGYIGEKENDSSIILLWPIFLIFPTLQSDKPKRIKL